MLTRLKAEVIEDSSSAFDECECVGPNIDPVVSLCDYVIDVQIYEVVTSHCRATEIRKEEIYDYI